VTVEPQPLELELPLEGPYRPRRPEAEDTNGRELPSSDGCEERPRVIVIDLA
jgi:hypothetical protein